MKRESAKVGFIFNNPYFLGGGEQSLFLLIEGLQGSSFEPVGIVPEKGEISERLDARRTPSAICPLSSLRGGTGKWLLRDLITLTKTVRSYGINIIHANGSRACLYGGLAGRILGIPVIWHVRETIRDYFLYDGLLGLLAKKIICASQAIAHERFGRFGALVRGRITVVHNGIVPGLLRRDEDKRCAIRTGLGMDGSDVLIVLLGNFVPLKGHEFAVRGIAEARRRKPLGQFQLLCAGRILDADYYQRILSLTQEEGIEDRVVLNDYTTDVGGVLSAADIFLLPSQREGFSRALLEAMVMELPVIATNIPSIAEAVEDSAGGILVKNGDVEAIACAICKLCQEPELRKRMGKKNRERVLKYFRADIHNKAIEDVYSLLMR